MLAVQNIFDIEVTIKCYQGHQHCNEKGKFTGDYPMAQFERSRLKSVQEGPKISFRRVRESVLNYPP